MDPSPKTVGDLVLGDPDCSFAAVTSILMKSSGSKMLIEGKWRELAYQLRTKPADIHMLSQRLNLSQTSHTEIIHHILEDWRSRHSTEAKLVHLLKILKALGFKTMAQKLEKYFNNRLKNATSSDSGENQNQTIERSTLLPKIESPQETPLNEQFLGFPNEPHASTRYLRCLSRYGISITRVLLCVACVSVIVFFTLQVILFRFQDSKKITHNSNQNAIPETTTFGPIDLSTTTEMSLIPLDLNVSSYSEYIEKSNLYTGKHVLNLKISLNKSIDWAASSKLLNSQIVKSLEIEGNFSLSIIDSLLRQAPDLSELTIINTNNSVCEPPDKIQMLEYEKTRLDSLKRLTFINIKSCHEVYEYLTGKIYFDKLLDISLINITLEDGNIQYIKKLIASSSELRQITMLGKRTTNESFYTKAKPLDNAVKLSLNIKPDESLRKRAENLLIGDDFCDSFPNLECFESQVSMYFSEFLVLLECTKLRNATAQVLFTDTKQFRNLDFYYTGENLRFVKLGIIFEMPICPTKSDIRRLGFHLFRKRVKGFLATNRSKNNCSIEFRRKGNDGVTFNNVVSIKNKNILLAEARANLVLANDSYSNNQL